MADVGVHVCSARTRQYTLDFAPSCPCTRKAKQRPLVMTDRSKVADILERTLKSATDAGGTSMRVCMDTKRAGTVTIIVSDNATGIPASRLSSCCFIHLTFAKTTDEARDPLRCENTRAIFLRGLSHTHRVVVTNRMVGEGETWRCVTRICSTWTCVCSHGATRVAYAMGEPCIEWEGVTASPRLSVGPVGTTVIVRIVSYTSNSHPAHPTVGGRCTNATRGEVPGA